MHRCFTSRTKIYNSCGDDFTIDGEGLQLFGLCSAFIANEQGGIAPDEKRNLIFAVSRKKMLYFTS